MLCAMVSDAIPDPGSQGHSPLVHRFGLIGLPISRSRPFRRILMVPSSVKWHHYVLLVTP